MLRVTNLKEKHNFFNIDEELKNINNERIHDIKMILGDSNVYTSYDYNLVEKTFDNEKLYEIEFLNYNQIHNKDFLYVTSIRKYKEIKYYKDKYPLLTLRKLFLYYMRLKK